LRGLGFLLFFVYLPIIKPFIYFMKKFLLIISAVFSLQVASAQTYTWAENTACIFYSNCTKCHFPGGPGPFSLIDYGSAFTARFAIKQAVLDNYMPPWQPDETYQTYAHERILTQQEKDIIVGWVDQGGLAGNLAGAPAPPSYNATGSQLPSLDYTGSLGNYTNPAATDDYRNFFIPTHLGVDHNIESIELIAGTRSMVHHALVYFETDTNGLIGLDNGDPGMGWSNVGGTGLNTSKLIYTWIPGTDPLTFPSGMAAKLPANAYIVVQLHYPQGTTGLTDSSTTVNLKYATGTVREVSMAPILDFLYPSQISPWPIHILPNSTASFVETYTLPSVTPLVDNYTVLNVQPHMHRVGSRIKVYAVKPGNDTVHLVNIPQWDFKWQGQYTFRQPIVLPEGTVVRAEAFYDNTSGNINSPNPSLNVWAGETSADEMMQVYFSYLYAFPGDEDIIVDTTTVHHTYLGCNFVGIEDMDGAYAQFTVYPNPSTDFVNVSFEQFQPGDVKLSLVDLSGKVLAEYLQPQVGVGTFMKVLDVQTIPAGMYYIRVWNGSQQFAKPLVVTKR
jgi:hypothetical protein